MDKNIKLDFQFERSLRIKSLKSEGQGALELFEHDIIDIHESMRRVIHKALKLAKKLTYAHGALSSEAYLAHPLRVASMALQYSKFVSANDIVLALLHNVYEVTNVSKQIISEQFGEEIEESISTLTVNRKLQWLQEYKYGYYNSINRSENSTKFIKILDKLDNVFVIGLNPDANIRKMYIDEIYKYILPMSKDVVPELTQTFTVACNIAEIDGYRPIDED